MSVEELNDKTFPNFLEANPIAIIEVFASWCGSCRLFAKSFDEVAGSHQEYGFAKIDGESNPKFAELLEIDNLPFIAVFQKGEYVGGKSTAKKEGLENMIQKLKEKL